MLCTWSPYALHLLPICLSYVLSLLPDALHMLTTCSLVALCMLFAYCPCSVRFRSLQMHMPRERSFKISFVQPRKRYIKMSDSAGDKNIWSCVFSRDTNRLRFTCSARTTKPSSLYQAGQTPFKNCCCSTNVNIHANQLLFLSVM